MKRAPIEYKPSRSALPNGSTVRAGTGSATAKVGGVLNVNTTSAATTGTSEEILATYTLPADTLSADGKGIRITAWGITAANANSKTWRVRFGGIAGTNLAAATTATSGQGFHSEVTLIRTGASAEIFSGTTVLAAPAGAAGSVVINATTSAQATTGAIDLVVTGTTPTAAGDLTFKGLVVEAIN